VPNSQTKPANTKTSKENCLKQNAAIWYNTICRLNVKFENMRITFEKPWLISNLMHKILIYSHIIHLLKSSKCFEHYPAHHQEVYVVIVYMQFLVSSLSAGDCPVHRLKSFFLTGAQDSQLQRVTIPEAAYRQLYNYDVDLLKMSRVMLETCRGL